MFDGVELLFASGIYILQLHRPWTLTGGFHVMTSCLRPFHTTCKSCYNLFHGFVDRQRVTVWSSAFENITCEMVSHLWELIHTTARTSTRTQTQKLPNTNLVYCDNFACLLNSEIIHYEVCFKSRYNLISRAWAKSSVLWSLSKLWSSKIRPLGTGIIRRHSLTRYLAGLVCSQTYT